MIFNSLIRLTDRVLCLIFTEVSPSTDTLLEATSGSRLRIAAWSFEHTELQRYPHGQNCR